MSNKINISDVEIPQDELIDRQSRQLRYEIKMNKVIITRYLQIGQAYENQVRNAVNKLCFERGLILPDIRRGTGVPLSFLKRFLNNKINRPCVAFVVALDYFVRDNSTEN